ncbi:Ras suppressor protein (contains leucine-rich repeats) [Handroanthus impetiginosus]|uniref:Ras suppressor protein (Contains leucine-rich repeats) n=1 Tax=Handroanthus impetiginosus TaxID=429701 RepID=A0A2G9HGD2_9LAMI|nr:Ras suppressor protein (contains leucine-rich repeats) [Handroanthus impetiginosus]
MMYEQQQVRDDMRNKRSRWNNRMGSVDDHDENKLEIVDLSGMSLDALPNPPVNLANICKLDLSNNNLQSIPESLTARLLNVIILDVRSNQLKFLPNSIGCLSKLKILNVSGNLLQSLPRTIENCRSLEELSANFNQLRQLPETIGFELLNLKKLSVNSNKLVFLPHSTSHLTNLRVLDARLNCLQCLPDDLENLINLQVLNVSQNFQHLGTLPYSIGLLISLVELDVSYNKITTLPESIGCLKKLQKLSVEGNPLVSPPMDVIEQGLHVAKEYLCDKINGKQQTSPKKKSWFGKLAKCGTFSGANVPVDRDGREGYIMPSYRPIDGLASPRYMGMFSPRRLFSPKTYFSR